MSEHHSDQPLPPHEALLQRLADLKQEVAQLEQQLDLAAPTKAHIGPNNQQLQEIVDHIPALIYIKNLEGRYLLINLEFEKVSGLKRQDVIGKTPNELFAEDLIAFFEAHDREAIAQNTLIEREVTSFDSATNQNQSYLMLMFPLHDQAGQTYATYGTITNMTTRKMADEIIRANQQQMQDILDNAPAMFYVKDQAGRYTLINRLFEEKSGLSRDQILGKTDSDLFSAQLQHSESERDVFETGLPHSSEWISADATFSTLTFPLRDANNAIYAVGGISLDVTERKQAEEIRQQAELQEQLIQAQAASLAELATPLLSISDQAVVMPLIGAIDTRRAQEIIVTLLEGVSKNQAQIAIIDITGVSIVDTQVANALIQAAQAVQLLGAQVIITGIRPEIAQTLVNLGVNLRSIMTLSSLHNGINYALRYKDQQMSK